MVAPGPRKRRRRAHVRIVAVRTKAEHRAALNEIELLLDAIRGTAPGRRLDVLARLVDDYEGRHESIEPPDPGAELLYHAESRGLNQMNVTKTVRGDCAGRKRTRNRNR